ncbi:MAG: protein-disulfide reductase DsbD domain-containing protein [Paracoccus sp. (in: a-proteobacteria)]
MKPAALAMLLIPLAAPVPADPVALPPGLVGARLLPGWTDADGHRIAALELLLEPGWKTYWRSPGDTGIPPSFDWQGSTNVGAITFHWPAPEVIDSGGSRSFGFHDQLILPFEVVPETPGQPVELSAVVDFGLCENICVPANLALSAPPSGDEPDLAIQAALAAQPQESKDRPDCTLSEIEDGVRIGLTLDDATGIRAVAVELPDRPEVWVSAPELTTDGAGGLSASADFVPPEGKPFELDPAGVRITLIGDRPAVEMQGCDAAG